MPAAPTDPDTTKLITMMLNALLTASGRYEMMGASDDNAPDEMKEEALEVEEAMAAAHAFLGSSTSQT